MKVNFSMQFLGHMPMVSQENQNYDFGQGLLAANVKKTSKSFNSLQLENDCREGVIEMQQNTRENFHRITSHNRRI